jgi:hypothetical protein
LEIEITESPGRVVVGPRMLAGALLGLMILRAGTVESLADPHPGESGTGFHVAVDGQAHHAGRAFR